MVTEGANPELAKWSHQWFVAAYLQAQRAVAALNRDDLAGLGGAETELLMFVDALNNARRGAVAVLGLHSAPVETFDAAVPGPKKLRDQLEHHDEYVRGVGRLQQQAGVTHGDQWWTTTLDGGIQWRANQPPQHGLRFGIISRARDEADPRGSREVASVLIDLVPSVQAIASLVSKTLENVGLRPTSYLKSADNWCESHLRTT